MTKRQAGVLAAKTLNHGAAVLEQFDEQHFISGGEGYPLAQSISSVYLHGWANRLHQIAKDISEPGAPGQSILQAALVDAERYAAIGYRDGTPDHFASAVVLSYIKMAVRLFDNAK